jgi:hypothetical protein
LELEKSYETVRLEYLRHSTDFKEVKSVRNMFGDKDQRDKHYNSEILRSLLSLGQQ